MDNYGQVLWLPVAAALSGVGLIISVLLWRRRGAASGLRAASWSLLPIGLYLLGLLGVLVPFAFKLAGWVAHLVFSLVAWLGIAVIGLAVLLWIISGIMLSRRRARDEAEDGDEPAVTSGRETPTKQVTASKPTAKAAAADDEFGDIEEILKRRGIT